MVDTESPLEKIKKDFSFLSDRGFKIIEPIGEGAYGCVVKAYYEERNNFYAIKKTRIKEENLSLSLKIVREIALLTYMRHPNIVELKQIEVEIANGYTNVYLIFDLYSSDLWKIVKSGIHLELIQIKLMMFQILHGLRYIHSKNVLHRDLKTGNILINKENFFIKICDFGLARTVEYEMVDVNTEEKDKDKVSFIYLIYFFYKETKMDIDPTNISESSKSISSKKSKDFFSKLKVKKPIKQASHDLTKHVATRWYRAPELILLQDQYGEAMDIWSVGCIFAELLTLNKKHKDRAVLFPGATCVTLSPNKTEYKINNSNFDQKTKRYKDQIEVIFDVIGTPSEEDMEFLSHEKAKDFIKMLPYKERRNFKDIFPNLDDKGIDFIESMLQFNPFKRPSANECLKHSYFDDIISFKEKLPDLNSYINILKKIEENDNIPLSFEFEKEKDLTFKKLTEYFIDLVRIYNKKTDW